MFNRRELTVMVVAGSVAVLAAFLPGIHPWWMRLLAIPLLMVGIYVERRLSRDTSSEPPALPPPASVEGLPPPPYHLVGEGPQRLVATLASRMMKPGLIGVVGESGLGKSTLCAAAINASTVRMGRSRAWVDMESCLSMGTARLLIARQLRVPTLTAEALVPLGTVRQTKDNRVLVLDHVETLYGLDPTGTQTLLRSLTTIDPTMCVVAVVQGHPLMDFDETVEPAPLSAADADLLLLAHAPALETEPRRQELLAWLGGTPRAVEIAGKVAAISNLEELLEDGRLSRLTVAHGNSRHGSVARAVELALQLEVVGQLERQLLVQLLQFPAGIAADDVGIVFAVVPGARRALSRLYEVGLLRPSAAGVGLVPVVAEYVGSHLPADVDAAEVRVAFVSLALAMAVSDDEQAARWIDRNRANIDHAGEHAWPGLGPLAVALLRRADVGEFGPWLTEVAANEGDGTTAAALLAESTSGEPRAWQSIHTRFIVTIRIYHRIGDRLGEANALHELGSIATLRGKYDAAAGYQEQALAIYRELGDRLGEANALNELGRIATSRSKYDAAADYQEQALAIYRELGARRGEASALYELGRIATLRGKYDAAADYQEQALAIYRELGARRGEANALYGLGSIATSRDKYDAAAGYQEQALAIYRELGDRLGEANALNELGRIATSRDKYDAAAGYQEQALAIYRELGDRLGEANALKELGRIATSRGKYDAAAGYQERALAIYRELGARRGEANALYGLGRIATSRGKYDAAAGYQERALAIYRELGARLGEANALYGLGRIATSRGKYDAAAGYQERALAIYRELGARLGEANALKELGRICYATEQLSVAAEWFVAARAIYDEIGLEAAWLGEFEQRLWAAREAWSSADAALESARATKDRSAAKTAIVGLVSSGLPRRARELAPEFELTVGADGIVRP